MPAPVSVAYVVVAHHDPAHLRRLATRLLEGDPDCRVIVRYDAAGPDPGSLGEVERVTLTNDRRSGGWGGYGIVDSTLRGLAQARESGAEWVVLLSGQDYPAVAPGALLDTLRGCGADALVDAPYALVERPRDAEGRWRYARYHYRWITLSSPPGVRAPARLREIGAGLLRWVSLHQPLAFVWPLPRGAGVRLGVRRLRTPFGPRYPCRVGSQWFAASRAALDVALAELERRPALGHLYRRSVIPDESLLNTVLLNAPSLRVRAPNLTFQRPDGPGDAHAATLTLDDLPAIRAAGRPLVRKVQAGTSDALLDALDGMG